MVDDSLTMNSGKKPGLLLTGYEPVTHTSDFLYVP